MGIYCAAILSRGSRLEPRVITTNALVRLLDDENSSRPMQSSLDAATGQNMLTFVGPPWNAVYAKDFESKEEALTLAEQLRAFSVSDLCAWVEKSNPEWRPLPEFGVWK